MTPEHFALREVAAGVWEAQADFTGLAIGNAAIVDAGGKTIVVDTFMSDTAATELRSVAEELTGNQVFLAVNSHWHPDHTNGNQVFGDIPLVSTRETRDAIAASAPAAGEWAADIDRAIDALTASADSGDSRTARRLAVQRVFREVAGRFTMTVPTLLIDGQLVVEGERTVEIRTHGRGHTVSDVFVWIPDERLVVTGDLAWNGIHPRLNDGFPTDWAAYVERLIELGPAHVVPGHGPPGGPECITGLPGYFREVAEMVEEVRGGTDPTTIDPPSVAVEWEGLDRFHAGLAALARR